MSALTYKMMAKRDNETIKSERSSAYMILSKARVWVSEGWTVTIMDPDGKTLAVPEFESRVSEQHPLPVSMPAIETAIAPDAPMAAETAIAAGADTEVADKSGAGADTLVTV